MKTLIVCNTSSDTEPFTQYMDSLRDRRAVSKIKTRVLRASWATWVIIVPETKTINKGILRSTCVLEKFQGDFMKRKYRTFDEYLIESLKDPEEAALYLNAAIEENDLLYYSLLLPK